MKDLQLDELLSITREALDKAKKDLGFVKPLEEANKRERTPELEEFDEEKHVGFIGIHPKQWGVRGSYEYNDLREVARNIIPSSANSIERFKTGMERINAILGVKTSESGDIVYTAGEVSSLNEVFSALQISNIMHSIINNQSAQSAGKMFETFIAALIGGYGTNNDDTLIEDLNDENGNPVSLKVIAKDTKIAGSVRNLAKTISSGKDVVYLVCIKNSETDPLTFKAFSFTINKDNYFNFVLGKSNLLPNEVASVINSFPPVAQKMKASLTQLGSMNVAQKYDSKVTAAKFGQADYKSELGDAIYAYARQSGDPALANATPENIEKTILERFDNMLTAAKQILLQLSIPTLDSVNPNDIIELSERGAGPFLKLGTAIDNSIKAVQDSAAAESVPEKKQKAEQALTVLGDMKKMRDGIDEYVGDAFSSQKSVSPIAKADHVKMMRDMLDQGFMKTIKEMELVKQQFPEIYSDIFKTPPESTKFLEKRYSAGGTSAIYSGPAQRYVQELYRNYNAISNNQFKTAAYLEPDPEIKQAYTKAASGGSLRGDSKAAEVFSRKQKEYAAKFDVVRKAMMPLITAYNNILSGGEFYTKQRTKDLIDQGKKAASEGLNKEYKTIVDDFWNNGDLIRLTPVKGGTQFEISSDTAKTLAASLGADLDIEYPTVLVGAQRLFNSAQTNADTLYKMIVPVFRDLHYLKNGLKKYFIYDQITGIDEAQSNSKQLITSAESLKQEVASGKGQKEESGPSQSLEENKVSRKSLLTDDFFDDIKKLIS